MSLSKIIHYIVEYGRILILVVDHIIVVVMTILILFILIIIVRSLSSIWSIE